MLAIADTPIQKSLSNMFIPLEFTIAFCSTVSTLFSKRSIRIINLSFCFKTVVTLSSIRAIEIIASDGKDNDRQSLLVGILNLPENKFDELAIENLKME